MRVRLTVKTSGSAHVTKAAAARPTRRTRPGARRPESGDGPSVGTEGTKVDEVVVMPLPWSARCPTHIVVMSRPCPDRGHGLAGTVGDARVEAADRTCALLLDGCRDEVVPNRVVGHQSRVRVQGGVHRGSTPADPTCWDRGWSAHTSAANRLNGPGRTRREAGLRKDVRHQRVPASDRVEVTVNLGFEHDAELDRLRVDVLQTVDVLAREQFEAIVRHVVQALEAEVKATGVPSLGPVTSVVVPDGDVTAVLLDTSKKVLLRLVSRRHGKD